VKFDISISTEITPEIIHYIQKGISNLSYCTETIETISKAVVHNQGTIYTIKLRDELYGVMVSSFIQAFPKSFFNVFLLSGKDMDLWKDQYYDFVVETARMLNARIIVWHTKGMNRNHALERALQKEFLPDIQHP